MSKSLNILIVDDNEDDAILIALQLRRSGYALFYRLVDTRDSMLSALDETEWDAILVDYNMPGFSGKEALSLVRSRGLTTPFILVSGVINEELSVELMRLGANDCIRKNALERLEPVLERELLAAKESEQHRQAEEKIIIQNKELARSNASLALTMHELENRNQEFETQNRKLVDAQVELKRSEERFRSLVENTTDLIWETDSKGNFTYISPQVTQVLGYKDVHLVEQPLSILLACDKQEWFRKNFLSKITSGQIIKSQICNFIHSTGKSLVFETNGIPIFNEKGVLRAFHGISRDITERKRIESERRQNQKMDSLGHLAGGVAHDFNNMLCGIMGAAELLLHSVEDDCCLKEYVNLIVSTADRAAELTDKLLTFSRKGDIGLVSHNVHDSIQHVIGILERSIDKRIRLIQESKAQNSMILADPSCVETAILNLAVNARDSMTNGGTLTIATNNVILDEAFCSTNQFQPNPGLYIQILVCDTGNGMSKDVLERIYEPFFTTKSECGGTGLGLAAVYGTVKTHKGAINVWSEVGEGTMFHLYFPVLEQNNMENVDVAQSEPVMFKSKTTDYGETAGCVLVIDDEETIRLTTTLILMDMGLEVLTAKNGREGIEIFKQNKDQINLVIMDMIMPEMNGEECFYAIKDCDPDAKIVMYSGFTRDVTVSNLKQNGLCDFLKKPCRRVKLEEMVKKWIASS
jgi:PAS domain S-box-containing protein